MAKAGDGPVLTTPQLRAALESKLPGVLERQFSGATEFSLSEAGKLTGAISEAAVALAEGLSSGHKVLVSCTVFGTSEGGAVSSSSAMFGDADGDSALAVTCTFGGIGCVVNAFLCQL